MTTREHSNSRILFRRRLFLFPALIIMNFAFLPARSFAHQAPTTMVLLDVTPQRVGMELQLPLSELELAFGHALMKNPQTVLDSFGAQLKEYLKAHIHPYVVRNKPWVVAVTNLRMDKGEQPASGPPYWEVVAEVVLRPQPGESTRHFILDYDAVLHQVINHVAFVSIRNDWETGRTGEEPTEAGVISRDMRDNAIHLLEINLEQGSWWTGFKNMIVLGMHHIKEGTDHLLFLLVLLLPSMLLTKGGRWSSFGGTRYSIVHLLKIVTAFTVGHSITLLIGALGVLKLPTQPMEVLIAVSILVSAIHAIRPVFPGKETYVAAGFGLIHGLAFASILFNLHLSGGVMALSILGFNIGIEIMQLFVIALIVPWLMLLSQTPVYQWLRPAGAVLAAIAAMAWIVERTTGRPNYIAGGVQAAAQYAVWYILLLAVVAVASYIRLRHKRSGAFRVVRGAD